VNDPQTHPAAGSRRLEVPVLVDLRGAARAVGIIDVTLQHRGRTVLAESPPPGLSRDLERTLREVAEGLAKAKGEAGVVTVELLADPRTGEFRLAGSSPRLPEEHAVLESLTGIDFAAWQLHLSRSGSAESQSHEPRGHAVQVCLSARDPENGLVPSPGVVETLRLPAGAGLRADPQVEEGEVPGEDLEITRVTAQGRNRAEALNRLQRGLARTAALVRGGTTDKALLLELLDRPEVDAATADPQWLDQLVAGGEHLPRRGAEAALLEAAIVSYEAELARIRARFYDSAKRGRPEAPREMGFAVDVRYRGESYFFRTARLGARLYRVEVDGQRLEVSLSAAGRAGRRLTCGEKSWQVFSTAQDGSLLVEADGIPHRIDPDPGTVVRCPGPAVVVSVDVQEGDEVAAGVPLVTLEAMKMETTVLAPEPGRVRRILVRKNGQVGSAAPLLILEPAARAATPGNGGRGARVSFEALAPDKPSSRGLEEVRRLTLGYDFDPARIRRVVSKWKEEKDGDRRAADEIFRIFTNIVALFRQEPAEDPQDVGRGSSEEYLFTCLRDLDAAGEGLPPAFLRKLRRALAHYGVGDLGASPELEESLFRIAVSYNRLALQAPPILALLEQRLERCDDRPELRDLLDRMIAVTQRREPAIHDLARDVRYRCFDRPVVLAAHERALAAAEADLAGLAAGPGPDERADRIRSLVECPQPLHGLFAKRIEDAAPPLREAMLEAMMRRYYRIRDLENVEVSTWDGRSFASAEYEHRGARVHLFALHAMQPKMEQALADLRRIIGGEPPEGRQVAVDLYVWHPGDLPDEEATAREIAAALADPGFPRGLRRVAVVLGGSAGLQQLTFRPDDDGDGGEYREDVLLRGIHPMIAQRLQLWRLRNFRLDRLPAPEGIWLFHGVAHENPRDERLFALAEVRDITPVRDEAGKVIQLPQFEHVLMEALASIRRVQARRPASERPQWNRVVLFVWPPVDLRPEELNRLVHRLAPFAEGLGMEKVVLRGRIPRRDGTGWVDRVLEISNPEDSGVVMRFRFPSQEPLKPLREYAQKVIELRRRGLVYPYEIVKRLAPPRHEGLEAPLDVPHGEFVEHDLDADSRLVPVHRPPGQNTANIVAGVIRNFTGRYPEGMSRVIVLGDPSRGMGALAEPECRRIIAALDLAERMGVPLEWFALSAGARISMDSGTENMDWIAKVLRRLVEFTQSRGEVNIVVPGINVGAQPYWNAEATMLMHTRGIVIMTPEGAMVLTGKQALDYSGGVSAEDNTGIGGYERIMGPNGQAQYFARDVGEACRILLRYYEHTWTAPGERFPRPAATNDPRDRDVRASPHGGELRTVGDVFSDVTNPGRKKPFEIRKVMGAVIDQDYEPLERWYGMRDAEIAVAWDAHLGGYPVCLLGFESKLMPRLGLVPAFGPDQWTGGTLFPLSSKKVARAINAASGNRPLVVLANLSGFDGSPESMRYWQLEYGAEIGRAVVNFRGPIVFVVVSRYHGGAFVVFSNALNDNMEVAALEGTHASVIGGAPAAAVVFAREVDKRTRKDSRIVELEAQIADPERPDKAGLRARLQETLEAVRSEKLGEVALEFDHIHSVQRAQKVGSIHHIIPPERLRPYVIEALERGMARELGTPAPQPELVEVP
jgi:acetyl-CoA carboxylase carboxyltransferase component/biotin carboxyl carrier protein